MHIDFDDNVSHEFLTKRFEVCLVPLLRRYSPQHLMPNWSQTSLPHHEMKKDISWQTYKSMIIYWYRYLILLLKLINNFCWLSYRKEQIAEIPYQNKHQLHSKWFHRWCFILLIDLAMKVDYRIKQSNCHVRWLLCYRRIAVLPSLSTQICLCPTSDILIQVKNANVWKITWLNHKD